MIKQSKFIICVLFVSFTLLLAASANASECHVTVLHFNDLHGYLEMPKKDLGGAERIAAAVARIDQENLAKGHHTLLFFGGDLVTGTPVSEKFKGEAEYKFMDAIGTELMVIGNHDFDFEIAAFKENVGKVSFPVISANITDTRSKQPFVPATYVFPLEEGCRVGVLGLTTTMTKQSSGADLGSLEFSDPISAAGSYIDDLAEQSEIKVALTHLNRSTDKNLIGKVKGFDVLIGGHDHVDTNEYCIYEGSVLLCETPEKGKYLGRVDLVLKDGKVSVEKTELIPMDKKAGKSKEVKSLVNNYFTLLNAHMGEVVGNVNNNYPFRPKKGEVGSILLGEMIARALKDSVKADVGAQNMGSIRAPLKKGKVTIGDVYEILPFDNEIVTVNLQGSDILYMVKRSEEVATPERPQPYLCWYGLTYKKEGDNYEIKINGKALDTNAKYKIALNSFIASGKDGYDRLEKIKKTNSGIKVKEAFIKFLKSGKEI